MKKVKKILPIIMITLLIVFFVNVHISIADVGSFETYSSDSSWSSSDSSWSSSSSWDHDSSSSYSSGYSGGGSGGGFGTIVAVIVIIAIIIILSKRKGGNVGDIVSSVPNNNIQTGLSESEVEAKVKAIDELFNKEEFIAWTKDLFVTLQEAWTARDWSTIRVFETNQLFEQHQKQLQGYIDNNQINVMERICVLSSELMSFEQSGDKDILSVRLKSKMVDYIIDATSKEILKGDKTTDRYSTYKLTFIRKTGVKTKEGTSKISTTNCPNCGAPTQITSAGKCNYCGSVITTGEYSWVLSDLTKIG